MDAQHTALLARYVDAFERYDMDALTALYKRTPSEHAALWPWLRTHRDISNT